MPQVEGVGSSLSALFTRSLWRLYQPILERITFHPNQCGGRPCIRGMRIRVKDVLELLAAGLDEAEILADYPCLEYAALEANHPVRVAR